MSIHCQFTEQDWKRIERDWTAWWAGELDRPLVLIEGRQAQSSEGLPVVPRFVNHFPLTMPAVEVLDCYQLQLEAKRFYGDSWPKWFPNFGPGIVAGFLGAKVECAPETVWFWPREQVRAEELHPTYRLNNVWWHRVQELTRAALQGWGSAVAVGHTDLGGNLDILASLLGTKQLLLALHDAPEEVERLAGEITRLWLRYYDELCAIICSAGRGTTCWGAIWSPGRCYMLQSDFSCMISPRMFERFVLPDIAACCDALDHGFYHLDGPGQIPHLDMLLSLGRLRGVQWIPGAGKPPPEEWLPLLKRIRDAGKLCQLYVTPHGARTIARELGGRGFAFAIVRGLDQQGFYVPQRMSCDEAAGFIRALITEGAEIRRRSCIVRRDYRDEIAGAIAEMPVVDHHEHTWRAFSIDHGQEYDLPSFLCSSGYLLGDLAAAGFCPEPDLFDYLDDPQTPDGTEKAWKLVRPFLDRVRSGSYFRCLLRSLRDLFGVAEDDIFSDKWLEASDRIRDYSRRHKGQGADLCARMGVVATVLDPDLPQGQLPRLDAAEHRILRIARMDVFTHDRENWGLTKTLEKSSAKNFGQWLAAFDDAFCRHLQAGAAGFKSNLAYYRRIEYTDPSQDEVAGIFDRGLLEASAAEMKTYQDFMINRLCRLCTEADVPLQIHTGAQAGTGRLLEDARPTLLTELFRRHEGLRVDLFHGGYPWFIHAGLMAKYFPNVHIDGCWLHHISPSAYRAALTSWIETVPLNKIFAWGGDHRILEHSYGSLALAKDLITDVLTDLVNRDYFDVDLALVVAKRILHDNGSEFWRFEEGRVAASAAPPRGLVEASGQEYSQDDNGSEISERCE
jgi:hypothetical protein